MVETIITIPLYEPLVMGFPFYMVLIGMLGLILIFGLMLFKIEVYDRMQPVWGFRDASASGKPQAIIRGMNGKIWLESVEYVANVFSAMSLPLKWIITAPVSGQMGKVNTIEVSDDWNIVHNVDIDYAIVAAVHEWNKDHPLGDDDHIFDSHTFMKHLMNGGLDKKFPDGVVLPPFRIVDMNEVRRYLPKWSASHHSGFINAKVEERLGDKLKEVPDMMKYALIAAGAVILAGVLAYVMITAAH